MEIKSQDTYIGVVAFLDILGTKGVWKNDPHGHLRNVTGLYDRFKRLVNYAKMELETTSKKLNLDAEKFSVDFETFSDTIIVSSYSKWLPLSDYDNHRRLETHLLFSAILLIGIMHYAIDKKIYLRGSLSVGKIYKKDKIFIGPAVDEAACDFEQSNWIGISLTPHAASLIDSSSPSTVSSILKEFFIPYDLSKKLVWKKVAMY